MQVHLLAIRFLRSASLGHFPQCRLAVHFVVFTVTLLYYYPAPLRAYTHPLSTHFPSTCLTVLIHTLHSSYTPLDTLCTLFSLYALPRVFSSLLNHSPNLQRFTSQFHLPLYAAWSAPATSNAFDAGVHAARAHTPVRCTNSRLECRQAQPTSLRYILDQEHLRGGLIQWVLGGIYLSSLWVSKRSTPIHFTNDLPFTRSFYPSSIIHN